MVFLLIRLIPGDIVDAMAGEIGPEAGASLDRAAIERRLGLDVPIHVQYARWIGQILRGNLGTMLRGDQPIVPILAFPTQGRKVVKYVVQ